MSFKIADGYVEVHAKHDRASTRKNAQDAVRESDKVGKDNEGSLLKWLFKSNPSLMRMLEAPIGSMFSSPIIFAAVAALATAVAGFLGTAITTALLTGVAGGFIAIAAMVHKKALEGPWNSMVEQVEGVFARASKPIVGPMISAINMIGPAFKRMEPTLTRIYSALAPLIEPFTGGMLGFLEAMLPGIERAMPGIQVVVLSLAQHMPGLGTAIGDFFATLAENGPLLARVVGLMMTWLENFFKVAGPILVFWMKGFAFWADAWNALVGGIKDGMQWLSETWAKIPGWWDSSWGAVSGWFKDLWSDITGFFTNSGESISNWWNDQISNISGWWSSTWGSVSTWFQELPGKIGEFLMSLPETIYGWFLKAFDTVFYLIGWALGTMTSNFIAFILGIPVVLQAGWDLVTKAISTAWSWALGFITGTLVSIGQNVWNFVTSIDDYFAKLGGWLLGQTMRMFNGIADWWDKLPGRLSGAAKSAWDAVTSWFNWAVTNLPMIATNMVINIVNAVKGLSSKLWNAGRDAIHGLVNGIESLMGWAVDMAWRAAKRIAQGFMDALKIGSPSKLMADEVGKWIPKGIAVGIDANMGDLERQAGMFSDLLTGARPPIGGHAEAVAMQPSSSGTHIAQIVFNVQLDKIQELEDIRAFLEGKLSGAKANSWAGNIYEKTGEYERSYR